MLLAYSPRGGSYFSPMPVLNNTSKLMCAYAGVVTITDPGLLTGAVGPAALDAGKVAVGLGVGVERGGGSAVHPFKTRQSAPARAAAVALISPHWRVLVMGAALGRDW